MSLSILNIMAPDVTCFISPTALQIIHTCDCDRFCENTGTVCQRLPEDEVVELSFMEASLCKVVPTSSMITQYEDINKPLPGFMTRYWSRTLRNDLPFVGTSTEEEAMALCGQWSRKLGLSPKFSKWRL